MKCKESNKDCQLELKLSENGDILEFCAICDFTFLHKDKYIGNNHLNPYKKEN